MNEPQHDGGADRAIDGSPQTMAGHRIMVIDDERAVALVFERVLIRDRHEVVVTSSGAEAIEVLSSDTSFDVLVCDLMMPGMTGMELWDAARAFAPQLGSRFVFMTGGAFTAHAQEFLEIGGHSYVKKPVDFSALRGAVRQAAERATA